jgi:hypothetical protein
VVGEQILTGPIGKLTEEQRATLNWATSGVPAQNAQDAAVYRGER